MVVKIVGDAEVLLTPEESALSDRQIAAQASADTTKADADYQDKPHGDQQCDKCSMFVPGLDDDPGGFCTKVRSFRGPQGWIWTDGWCKFFKADELRADYEAALATTEPEAE